jgi:gamma-glutamyltranspeptidase/glutathione hydrolase
MPGTRTGAGLFAASMTDNLSRAMRTNRQPVGASNTAVAQALSAFGVANLPADLGSTGFAAVDASGAAASCAVTLNGPFGSGRTATGTGVVLAATPSGPTGLASAFLTPVIATTDGQVGLAGVGAGGPGGTAATVYALLEAVDGRPLGRRGSLQYTGATPTDSVNVISCNEDACVALIDPGAHGAGVTAEVASQ